MATSLWASSVEAPRCGVTTTFGCPINAMFCGGSSAKTSRATPSNWPDSRPSKIACSSTNSPRATLMSRAPGLSRAICLLPIMCLVLSVKGVCSVMKSTCANNSSSETRVIPMRLAWSGETNGSYPTSFISKLWARLATSEPTRPSPQMPRVLLRISTPMKALRFHSPDFSDWWADGTFRDKASINAMVCSAAATVLPVGALTTAIPALVAASRSMLSTPIPARPTTFNNLAASMTSLVTLVSLRTTRPSYSLMMASSSGGFIPVLTSTSARDSSSSIPSAPMGSATRILGM